jgi:hypothetical protein
LRFLVVLAGMQGLEIGSSVASLSTKCVGTSISDAGFVPIRLGYNWLCTTGIDNDHG